MEVSSEEGRCVWVIDCECGVKPVKGVLVCLAF